MNVLYGSLDALGHSLVCCTCEMVRSLPDEQKTMSNVCVSNVKKYRIQNTLNEVFCALCTQHDMAVIKSK